VRFLLFAFLCLPAAVLHAQKKPVSGEKSIPLFTLAGGTVTTEEFAYLFRKNHPKKADFAEDKVSEYLDLLITFKAKVAEATARGYDTTRAFRKEFATYRAELRKPYTPNNNILENLTQQAYERMKIEIRASHILLSVKPDALPADTLAVWTRIMALRERIMAGEDFAALAKANSEDPSPRSNGGDLGYFTVLQMVYPFEEAAYKLKTGEVSYPVRSRFGYHLIRVADRRLARGEVEVSHIILRTGTPDDKKVKAKIFDIYNQLQGGRSWDELCTEYSDDQSTKNSGGRLRPFGVGALAGVPEFENVAFSLHTPGEISDPFQSAYGWHVVRLERRIPIPPYEAVAESLRKRISRDERYRIAEEQAVAARLNAFGFTEQENVKLEVIKLADTTLLQASWHYRGPQALLDKILFTLGGKSYSVKQFVDFVQDEQQFQSLAPALVMEQLMRKFASTSMEELEEDELLKTKPEYRNLVNEYREGILLFTIMEKEVWNKASEDTLGLRKFYEANRTKYQAGERVRATIFATDDSLFFTKVKSRIASGDSIPRDEVKKFRSIQGPRNFAPAESKAVDRVPRVIGMHTTKLDGNYYLVQVNNLVPPGVRGLDEIRAQVISDYQDSLEKQWVKHLRAKYPVRVNGKAKKYVIRELTQP